MKADVSKITETILGIERSINERWNNGDCNGFIETYSEDVTYFDPATEKLLVGRRAVEDHIRRLYKNPHVVRSEYLNGDWEAFHPFRIERETQRLYPHRQFLDTLKWPLAA